MALGRGESQYLGGGLNMYIYISVYTRIYIYIFVIYIYIIAHKLSILIQYIDISFLRPRGEMMQFALRCVNLKP